MLEKDHDRAKVDFGLLGAALARGYEPLLRTYYYNCPPYQSKDPTDEERSRVGKADRFYASLRRLPNLEIRLGRLELRGYDKETARPIFEQKRVDIWLAVDLLTLTYSGQIATAVLVAGDSDFIPAVRAAKDRGVRIVLWYGSRENPAHADLVSLADERRRFDDEFIRSVRRHPPTG